MMTIKQFSTQGLVSLRFEELERLLGDLNSIIWIDVSDPRLNDLDRVAQLLNFHPLALEDCRNELQRPKVEEYDDHLFIIVNAFELNHDELVYREVDMFVGKNYLVTVHSGQNNLIKRVSTRLGRTGMFRHYSSEFIFYTVFDTIVDDYFPLIDQLEDEIIDLEDRIVANPDQPHLQRTMQLKRMINEITRVASQQENMFAVLSRHKEDLLLSHEVLEYYLRDVHDHLIKCHNNTAIQAENLTALISLYMSSTSNHLGRVVNRLTAITLIVGVFTVISGFYGMNFEHTFPMFDFPLGVPVVVLGMMLIAMLLVIWFRRNKLL